MSIRSVLFTITLLYFPALSFAQPSGLVGKTDDDMAFRSDSEFVVIPTDISISLKFTTRTGNGEKAVSAHIEERTLIYDWLSDMNISYSGQEETEFETESDGSLFSRRTAQVVSSKIVTTIENDIQLVGLAALIGQLDDLIYESFSANYAPKDSLKELQKTAIEDLIRESTAYQGENNIKLSPKGISMMDINTQDFGEESLQKLLEENDLDSNQSISEDQISFLGIQHRISIELLFH